MKYTMNVVFPVDSDVRGFLKESQNFDLSHACSIATFDDHIETATRFAAMTGAMLPVGTKIFIYNHEHVRLRLIESVGFLYVKITYDFGFTMVHFTDWSHHEEVRPDNQ